MVCRLESSGGEAEEVLLYLRLGQHTAVDENHTTFHFYLCIVVGILVCM